MSFGRGVAYDALIALFSVSFLLLVILLFILCRKKTVKSPQENVHIPKITTNFARPYLFADVDTATDGFNPQRIIGKGRLGTVYAGILPNGDSIAVKRIHPRLVLGNTSSFGFSSVLKTLSLASHPNILPILGISEGPGERIFLMEYAKDMVNLDFYLHQSSERASILDWGHRLRIAADIARGIEYLHEKMVPHVVHGCIKASNVLIDANFSVKICDYGLSFLAPNEKRGLLGHVDDEYWVDHRFGGCKESDVYGLGVVLLEILSGRVCDEGLLVLWAIPIIKEMRYSELLDPRLVIPFDIKPISRLAKVALACVGNSRKHRPSIVQVSTILNNLSIN